MKHFIISLALVALAQAAWVNWSKIESKEIHVPVKGFPSLLKDNNRIINGQEAAKNQFPYQVALFLDSKFCGGSLISKRYILTAAHCVDGVDSIIVSLGSRNLNEPEEGQVWMYPDYYDIHEKWNRSYILNDIAIIHLSEDAPITDAIQTISLPNKSQKNEDFVDQLSTISGWGKDHDNAPGTTDKLNYVRTKIVSNKVCSQYFGFFIRDTTICASGEGIRSSCSGDSGGPLTVNKNGETIQVGIASFVSGSGCEKSIPHAYTRVTKYLDWIQEHSDVVFS